MRAGAAQQSASRQPFLLKELKKKKSAIEQPISRIKILTG